MTLTVDSITQGMVNQLKLLDPTISAEVGTPERKIIEATAELIASQQVDFSVLNSQTDVSTLSAGRLDAYLSIYNFGRQNATPSYGTVTFSRTASATAQIVIPRGTQIQANIDNSAYPSLVFVTTETAVLEINSTSVDATVQCTVAGTVGNIDSGKVVGFAGLQAVSGISSVKNKQAFTGGQDQETDDQYRTRFLNGFLRNISGTEDMFLALAVSLNSITKASVVGPQSRYQEYFQIPLTDDASQHTVGGSYDPAGTTWPHKRTTPVSTIPYSKYTYQSNYYMTDSTLDPATAYFYRPNVDYVFNSPPIDATSTPPNQVATTPTTSPNITFLNAYDAITNPSGNQSLTKGNIVLVEHAYMSTHSRNDSTFGIYNCVDIFVNGENLQTASSVEVVPTSAHNLQNTNTAVWTYQHLTSVVVQNFTRVLDGVTATVGSRVQPLYWQPVKDLPDTIQVGTNTYYKANYWNSGDSTYYNQFDGTTYSFKAHYILVEETNTNYGTIRSRSGIEWFLAGNNYLNGQLPSDTGTSYSGVKIDTLAGTQFNVFDYIYDQNVSDLQALVEANRTSTQDALVHGARYRYLKPIVTIMYSIGSTQVVVNTAINAALSAFFENQYYGSAIQLSDILQTIHNVPGVDNVRWTNQLSNGNKVEEVSSTGLSFASPVYQTGDFYLQDNELAASPSANQITITVRAGNTWNS